MRASKATAHDRHDHDAAGAPHGLPQLAFTVNGVKIVHALVAGGEFCEKVGLYPGPRCQAGEPLLTWLSAERETIAEYAFVPHPGGQTATVPRRGLRCYRAHFPGLGLAWQ